nr:MAG TPA: hypothetical protein [Caudoviricetes sp.]
MCGTSEWFDSTFATKFVMFGHLTLIQQRCRMRATAKQVCTRHAQDGCY